MIYNNARSARSLKKAYKNSFFFFNKYLNQINNIYTYIIWINDEWNK